MKNFIKVLSNKHKIVYRLNHKNSNRKILIAYFDDKIKQEAEDNFLQSEISYLDLNNINHNDTSENIHAFSPDLIITDSEKIFKKFKKSNAIYYKSINEEIVDLENVLITSTKMSETFRTEICKGLNSNYYSVSAENTNGKFYELVKNGWKKLNKIIEINENNKLNLALKVNKLWVIKEDIEIEHLFSIKSKYSIFMESFNKNNNSFKVNNSLSINNSEVNYTDAYFDEGFFKKKIDWLMSEFIYVDIQQINNDYGFTFFEKRKFKLSKENKYEDFVNQIQNKKHKQGIEYNNSEAIESGIKFNNANKSCFEIKRDGDSIDVDGYVSFDKNENEVSKYIESTHHNLKSHINNDVVVNRLKPSQIINSIIGFLILILLITFTFQFIFDTNNIEVFFESLLSWNAWNSPWLYLIIASFTFSFFTPFFIAFIVEKLVLKKKKMSWKRVSHYFLAGALRNTATFLTGNFFVAMFVWGWYLNKSLNVRVAALAGAVSAASIFKLLALFAIGMVFMTSGTISYFLTYNNNPSDKVIWVFVISWIGFFYELLHNAWIYFLIISPYVIRTITYSTLRFKNRKKKYNKFIVNNAYYHNLSFMNTRISLNWSANKERIVRMMLVVGLPIIVEGIETIYYFNYVEHFIAAEAGFPETYEPYFNFVSLSGLRFVSSQIHHFPIINILPGRGMLFSEFGLNSLYEAVYTHKHGMSEIWNGYTSSDLSQITTFMTRFFNVYLNNSIIILVTIIVVTKELLIRRKNLK